MGRWFVPSEVEVSFGLAGKKKKEKTDFLRCHVDVCSKVSVVLFLPPKSI